jgi:hypothetical protein
LNPILFCLLPGPVIPNDNVIIMQNVSPTCGANLVRMTTLPTEDAIAGLQIVCKQTDYTGGVVVFGNGPSAHTICQTMGLVDDGGVMDDILNGR